MTNITVCIGSSCHLKNSYDVVNGLDKLIKDNNLQDQVVVKASFCLGNCTKPVCVKINEGEIFSVNKDTVVDFFNKNILSI